MNPGQTLLKPFVGGFDVVNANQIVLHLDEIREEIVGRIYTSPTRPGENVTVRRVVLDLAAVNDFQWSDDDVKVVSVMLMDLREKKSLSFWESRPVSTPVEASGELIIMDEAATIDWNVQKSRNATIDQVRDMLKQDFGVRAMDGVVFQIEAVTGATIEHEDAMAIVEAMLKALEET